MSTASAQTWIEMFPGVRRRALSAGVALYQIEVRLDRGSVVPAHSHPHEQVSYLVSGRLRFRVGAETRVVGPGDGVAIPGGVEHEVEALDDALVVDTFSPPREDYLAQDREASGG